MIFANRFCPVESCPLNKGGRGVLCGFAGYGRPCRHAIYRRDWEALTEAAKEEAEAASKVYKQASMVLEVSSG